MDKKELNKDLVLAIEWAAAEYEYVQKLNSTLKLIEEEKDVNREIKEIRKALHLLRYLGASERRSFKFTERAEKDLKELYEELSKHVDFDFSKKHQLMELIKEIDIASVTLLTFASKYGGILRKNLTRSEAEAELLKSIKNPERAEKVHSALKLINCRS